MKNLYGVDDFYRIVFSFIRITFFFFTLGRNEDVFIFIKKYTMTTALRQINNIK